MLLEALYIMFTQKISIIDVLELINKYLPNCYYSILFMDASFLPGDERSENGSVYEQINNDIKNYSSGHTSNFATILSIAKKFNDVMNLYIVVNKDKPKIVRYDKDLRQKYINNSFLEFFIEDLDLIELNSSDKCLEKSLKNNLGNLPIRITT